VALCHARRDPDVKGIRLSRKANQAKHFSLSVSKDWVKLFPQSAHLLNEECVAWDKTPWSLSVAEA
jgi:exopolyphosphatase/guanosine-5'-triphosphate,3'-diphosphate pyrophosphatase